LSEKYKSMIYLFSKVSGKTLKDLATLLLRGLPLVEMTGNSYDLEREGARWRRSRHLAPSLNQKITVILNVTQ
jgi:hypothetical protein